MNDINLNLALTWFISTNYLPFGQQLWKNLVCMDVKYQQIYRQTRFKF